MLITPHQYIPPLPVQDLARQIKLSPAEKKAVESVVEAVSDILLAQERAMPDHKHKLLDEALDAYSANPSAANLAAVTKARADEEAAKLTKSELTQLAHSAAQKEIEKLAPVADKFLNDLLDKFTATAATAVKSIEEGLALIGGGGDVLAGLTTRITRTKEALEQERGTIATGASLDLLCAYEVTPWNPFHPLECLELRDEIAKRRAS